MADYECICSCGEKFSSLDDLLSHAEEKGGLTHGDAKAESVMQYMPDGYAGLVPGLWSMFTSLQPRLSQVLRPRDEPGEDSGGEDEDR